MLSLLVLATVLQGTPGRPYAEERQLLDRHLAQLAKALPDAPTPVEDAALLKVLATEAGLRDVEIGPPTVTETGSLGQSRRTLSANATFPDADRFFRALQGSPRLIDVESVVLRAAAFGVRVETRVRLHHRAARAVPGASLDPARSRNRTRGASKEDAARFLRDEQIALDKTIALDDLRKGQTSARMFMAETGSAFRDAPAALTFGSLDGDSGRFNLRGVVAGMGAADALERRIEGGFFRLREFSRAQKEGCFEFEIVGESYRAGPEAALPLPVDEPFRPTDPLCHQDRDAANAAVAATIRASGTETGGVWLRAVDADLVDVAAMIEALTHEPFVVAEDVRGRVSVDFAGASIDDAIKALPAQADHAGGVRLLRAPGATLPVPEGEDAPPSGRFSLRAKRTRGESVIAAMAETEPAYVALGPSGLPRVSVFAREARIDDLRRAVLVALQLEETREESSRILKRHDGPGEARPIAATAPPRVSFRARDLTVEEMALAGIGKSAPEGELLAFVYAPLGDIVVIRLGDTLADGVIAGLDANGVLVDTAEGPVRISLATVRAR